MPAPRPYLDRYNIPIIRMTATANVEKLKSLCRILQFDKENGILIRETTNRRRPVLFDSRLTQS
jgi:hypothetical protein